MFGSFEQGSALIRCVLLGNLLQKELRGEAASLMGEILLCGGGGGSEVLSWRMEACKEGRRVISCGLEVAGMGGI